MNIPGFTAEASLYSRGGVHYVTEDRVPMTELGPQTVLPSQAGNSSVLERLSGNNWWHCWYLGRCVICCSQYWCWWYCYGYGNAAQR